MLKSRSKGRKVWVIVLFEFYYLSQQEKQTGVIERFGVHSHILRPVFREINHTARCKGIGQERGWRK